MVGHNSGDVNNALKKEFEAYDKLNDDIKELRKEQAAIRTRIKDEFGIQKQSFTLYYKMWGMEQTALTDILHGVDNMNQQLGYQISLNLFSGHRTSGVAGEADEQPDGDQAKTKADDDSYADEDLD